MTQMRFVPTKGTMFVVLCASMVTLMGATAVSPALPLISEAFPDAAESLISLIITLPSLAVALTSVFIGRIIDRVGKVPVLTTSLLLFTFAGVSGYFLDSLPAILVGRVFLGISLGGIMTSVTTLITAYYSGEIRDKVLGYEGAFIGIGMLILEISGGVLSQFSWRTPFLIYLIGLVILLGVFLRVREPDMETEQTESMVQNGEPSRINIPITLGIILLMFFYGFVLFLLPTKLPYLIDEILPDSSMITGIILGTMGVCSAISGLIYGRISRLLRKNFVFTLAFLLTACGFAVIGTSSSIALIGVGTALAGFAIGMLFPSLLSWVSNITPAASMGVIMGLITMVAYLGEFSNSVFIPLAQEMLGSVGEIILFAAAVCLVLGVAFAVSGLIKKRKSMCE